VAATVNEDKLAIHIYRRAAGKPITLGTVEQHLDELLAHQPGCGCGLCAAAATVRPWGVWMVVSRRGKGTESIRRSTDPEVLAVDSVPPKGCHDYRLARPRCRAR
jgi:hypothetical protein